MEAVGRMHDSRSDDLLWLLEIDSSHGGRTRRSREEPTHMYIGASPYTAASTYTQRSPEELGEAGKSQGEAGGAKENQEPIRRSEDPNACRSGPLTDPQKRFPSPQAQDDSRVWLLKRTPTCVPAYIHMYTHMYIDMYTHTYIHTDIRTYRHTYIHT